MGGLPAKAGTSPLEMSTSGTPGVWAVSHHELKMQTDADVMNAADKSADEIGTVVHFCWTVTANSAFVTGDFNNWEVVLPMTKVNTRDGEVWIASKTLPPGSFQYKFIIDNNWRHAEDQPTVYDERGIINNCLTVTVDVCGDDSCFCSSLTTNPANSDSDREPSPIERPIMTPGTMKVFQRSTGIAYTYVERESTSEVRKTYMHKKVNHQPFDVVVVDVSKLKNQGMVIPKDGLISRASSFEDLSKRPMRYDPTLSVVRDAAYEAALRADEIGSIPHTAPSSAGLYTNDPRELNFSVRARLSSPLLGFNPRECHTGIQLIEKNHYAIRVEQKGLYKTVRSALPLLEHEVVYFEMYVAKQERGGGICIGLSTRELPLSCLVGTRPNSIGFSTSGSVIQTVDGKESWTKLGRSVDEGSTVGCLVKLDRSEGGEGLEVEAQLNLYIDGEEIGQTSYHFVGALEIFPTLSLFARDGKVFSVFDANDMQYGHKLPSDVQVVALDGNEISRQQQGTG